MNLEHVYFKVKNISLQTNNQSRRILEAEVQPLLTVSNYVQFLQIFEYNMAFEEKVFFYNVFKKFHFSDFTKDQINEVLSIFIKILLSDGHSFEERKQVKEVLGSILVPTLRPHPDSVCSHANSFLINFLLNLDLRNDPLRFQAFWMILEALFVKVMRPDFWDLYSSVSPRISEVLARETGQILSRLEGIYMEVCERDSPSMIRVF